MASIERHREPARLTTNILEAFSSFFTNITDAVFKYTERRNELEEENYDWQLEREQNQAELKHQINRESAQIINDRVKRWQPRARRVLNEVEEDFYYINQTSNNNFQMFLIFFAIMVGSLIYWKFNYKF